MSKLFRSVLTRRRLRLCAVLLLVVGAAVGQERRPPTLEGGVRQQERRQEPIRGGVRQREEIPDDYSITKMIEGDCRAARESLDLYYRAASNTGLVLSDEWEGVDERLYAGMASCLDCPMGTLKIYIELLRRAQLARANPRERAETYKQLINLETGNDPGRGAVSLQAYDQAVQRWRQKIQETLKAAEGCFKTACTETLQVIRDASPPERRSRGPIRGSVERPGGGGLPPLPPAMPPTPSGGVEERPPAKAAKKKQPGDDKTGPPPWAIAIAGGVFLATEEGVKDLLLPAAATGVVCVSAEGIKHQIAQAAEWELYAWDHYKDLQGLDHDLMVETQRHMERVDQFTREARGEPGRHAEAMRRLEQQERLAEQRYRAAQNSTDPLTRETALDRFEQNKYQIQKMRTQELNQHTQNVKTAPSRLAAEAKLHRSNLENFIDQSNLPAESKAKLKSQAEGLGRFLERELAERQDAAGRAAEQARIEHARVREHEAERRLHLENFRREWEAARQQYGQTIRALNDEWGREQTRHGMNPFKNEAEGARHGEALARINAKMRCAVADHLAKLDAVRLKYQVW